MWEFLGSLLQGIPTLIVPDLIVKDASRFIGLLAAEKVTRIVLVPSLLRSLLATSEDLEQRLPHLKILEYLRRNIPC